ncbi:AbrB/MazE/SpoVT family DNA-binding domain-containing protein [Endothiovibrio diazotrophicus]
MTTHGKAQTDTPATGTGIETCALDGQGALLIPSTLRRRHHWAVGTRFTIEEDGDALIVRPAKPFPPTHLEEGLGCTGYLGPAKSLEEMEAGITEALRFQWRDEQGAAVAEPSVRYDKS